MPSYMPMLGNLNFSKRCYKGPFVPSYVPMFGNLKFSKREMAIIFRFGSSTSVQHLLNLI